MKNYGLYGQGASEAEAAAFADSNIDSFAAKPANGWTDWKDELFKTGGHQNYQVSVSGGGQNTQFYSSLSYTKQDAIIQNQGLEVLLTLVLLPTMHSSRVLLLLRTMKMVR